MNSSGLKEIQEEEVQAERELKAYIRWQPQPQPQLQQPLWTAQAHSCDVFSVLPRVLSLGKITDVCSQMGERRDNPRCPMIIPGALYKFVIALAL